MDWELLLAEAEVRHTLCYLARQIVSERCRVLMRAIALVKSVFGRRICPRGWYKQHEFVSNQGG